MRTADNFAVRIGEEELGRIFHLRENLAYSENLARHAVTYAGLGWRLAALDHEGAACPGLDLQQEPEVWSKPLTDEILNGARVNLAVLTGEASRLLVVEFDPPDSALPEPETWRASCIATDGRRERHFLALPPGCPPFPSGLLVGGKIRIYGEGGKVLAPPSLEPQGGESWKWLESPEDNPPQPPGPALWDLLQERLDAESPLRPEPEIIAWERLYPRLAPHPELLQAFLQPAATVEEYCRTLLTEARAAELREEEVLLSLMWYAPQGEAGRNPEQWEAIKELVARADGPKLEAVGRQGAAWYKELRAVLAAARKCSEPQVRAEASLASGKGDLGLSHQVLQPLAELRDVLGDKVPPESQLYQAMTQELEKIAGKAKVLEERLTRWEQHFQQPAAPAADPSPAAAARDQEKAPALSGRLGGSASAKKAKQEDEIQEATRDFLEKHGDLAADPDKAEMVDFCLKNYVNIDPSLASLPHREKLARAARMAREFLGEEIKGGP